MTDELLFTVQASVATAATPISLADAGLKERQDLQEWVLSHPELLGPGVMVVTFEFDRWWSASGDQPLDRLDVLGLDDTGRLVVAELKRDKAPDTVEMQAIKYAATVSRFTLETLAEQHARFLTQRGTPTSSDDALASLTAHAPDITAESLRRPRIVLGGAAQGQGVPHRRLRGGGRLQRRPARRLHRLDVRLLQPPPTRARRVRRRVTLPSASR